jgi:hypothetical protein
LPQVRQLRSITLGAGNHGMASARRPQSAGALSPAELQHGLSAADLRLFMKVGVVTAGPAALAARSND